MKIFATFDAAKTITRKTRYFAVVKDTAVQVTRLPARLGSESWI
jgi:hypothetical protein